jgi:hypothetical protein
MGIRFSCPNGHKLNVKAFLAGKRGVCPQCGAKFIIPAPAETVPAATPQPVAVGQEPSVEIVVAPNANPVTNPVGSPSVIIPVSESAVLEPNAPAQELESEPPPPPVGECLADALPPASVAGIPVSIPEPAEATAQPADMIRRDRMRRMQLLMSVMLLTLVLVLGGVLIWVLKREAANAPVEKEPAAASETAPPGETAQPSATETK